ncbi:hypothetical protein PGTUg99_017766 [Puccinia graminis f. sp. tritici]|uniref:Uncharacterized protein n=1 Tax=Puccinia graminis f. sp. tritici TaxID=56615 RepID=A0A5B0M2U8_PUCGR|nr:hypothetical protein PGTUg99_017766 [Puccinia graminis f. sp. tritici]
MAEKNCKRPRFPYKKSFNDFSATDSRHSLAEVTTPIPSDKRTISPKKNKLRSTTRKHRGDKKNVWSPISHYVPTSFTLSLDSISPKQPSPRFKRRWSSKPMPSETAKSMSSIKQYESSSFKHQAKGVFRRIFLSAKKSLIPSKTKLTRRPSSSSWRSRPKNASEDPLNPSKPKISYPMKLHNSDLTFVTTQDPWETSVRSSSLHRRATVGTTQSHNRSRSCTESRFSSCQPSQEGKRLSCSIQQRVSKDSISNPNPHMKLRQEGAPLRNRSACTDRPKSSSHARVSSSDSHSKRSQNHSFPPNRGSLYRHPPTRPLSLCNHSRRNSILLARDDNARRSNIDESSRRSSMTSSNQLRQSWTTGRVVLDTSTAQGSGLSCSERSSVITSGTDQKSVSSYRRPANNDWAGVIEEDITLTLMGCPASSPTTQRASPVAAARPTPPPTATSSVSPPAVISPIPSSTLAPSISSAEDASLDSSSEEDVSVGNLHCEDTPRKQVRPEDLPIENSTPEYTPRKHARSEDEPLEDSSLEYTPRRQLFSEDASSLPPSVDAPPTTTTTLPTGSSTPGSPDDASVPPPCAASSPTPPSTPSPPPSLRSSPPPSLRSSRPPSLGSISLAKLHRPLSLMFESMGSSQLDGIDGHSKRRSDWYAELMTTVEETISKLD